MRHLNFFICHYTQFYRHLASCRYVVLLIVVIFVSQFSTALILVSGFIICLAVVSFGASLREAYFFHHCPSRALVY